LETTVGRMEKSPRILLVDTIGFIDNIPNATLTAFKATIAEAIDADLTLILVDASDSPLEIERKIETTQREVMERQRIDDDLLDDPSPPHVVLTKIDLLSEVELQRVIELVEERGFLDPVPISSREDTGIDGLQMFIRKRLFGEPCTLSIHPPASSGDDASERIVADVYENGMVESKEQAQDGTFQMVAWLASPQQARLKARWLHRIDIK